MANYPTEWGASPPTGRERRQVAVHRMMREAVRDRFGFIDSEQLAAVAAVFPFRRVLVRCGGCRFVVTAGEAGARIDEIERAGDYVRDVSLYQGGSKW